MARGKQGRNRYRKRNNNTMVLLAAIIALVVLAAAAYFFRHHGPWTSTQGPQGQPPSAVTTRAMPERPAGYANVTSPAKTHEEGQETTRREQTAPGQPERALERKVEGSGLLAVVIDDMGASMQEARTLAGIGVPLTFSIIPGLHNYREVASFAAILSLIHI